MSRRPPGEAPAVGRCRIVGSWLCYPGVMADVLERPEVDELYAADPAEFVAARNALVKQLKADGDKEGAAAIGALQKPTKVAWAINQVVRQDPGRIAELRAAGEELRDRQAEALSSGEAGALRDAAAARRDVVRHLASAVVTLVGAQAREEAAATFEAASVDDEVGALLAAGRLTTTVPRSGDLGFLGMPEPGPTPTRPRRGGAPPPARSGTRPGKAVPTEPDSGPPVRIDRRSVARLEKAATAAEDAVADAERAATRAAKEHERAADRFADAQARLDAAVHAVAKADERVAHARDVAAAARKELDAARG